ncbi:MAG: low temperature requirement protein A [Jatrophihabitans sp.]
MVDEPAPTVEELAAEKRVSWAELFVDLVFVFAVTEVSSRLVDDHLGLGLLRALAAAVGLPALAVLLGVLSAFEWLRVADIGWRARLARPDGRSVS